METKELKEINVVKNLNTTFEESLKSWMIIIYLFSPWEKRYWGITADWQYKFTLYKKWNNKENIVFWEDKIFSEFLWDNENTEKTWESIKEQVFESFEYSSLHNQLWWHWIPNKVFSLENINEIDDYLTELEKNKTKLDIKTVLN